MLNGFLMTSMTRRQDRMTKYTPTTYQTLPILPVRRGPRRLIVIRDDKRALPSFLYVVSKKKREDDQVKKKKTCWWIKCSFSHRSVGREKIQISYHPFARTFCSLSFLRSVARCVLISLPSYKLTHEALLSNSNPIEIIGFYMHRAGVETQGPPFSWLHSSSPLGAPSRISQEEAGENIFIYKNATLSIIQEQNYNKPSKTKTKTKFKPFPILFVPLKRQKKSLYLFGVLHSFCGVRRRRRDMERGLHGLMIIIAKFELRFRGKKTKHWRNISDGSPPLTQGRAKVSRLPAGGKTDYILHSV